MPYRKVATLDDFLDGEMISCSASGCNILLVRHASQVYAYEDRCAHQGMPLSQGQLDGNVLTCCAHHWQYDVCSGRGINPANARLRAMGVRLLHGSILVDIAGKSP